MRYSKENLPPIGLIFSYSGGTYEIMRVGHSEFKLKSVDTEKLYDYGLSNGLSQLNNGNWTIKKIPILDYEIF